MSSSNELKKILKGQFEILDLFNDTAPGNISGRFSFMTGLETESISNDEIRDLFEYFLSQGSILRALTLLKILSLNDREGNDLSPLLKDLIERETLADIKPAKVDLLVTNLLGTHRPSVAWNNLMKTNLIFQALSPIDMDIPQSDRLVCSDETPIQPHAPYGMALYLRIANALPDSSNPIWNRKNTRMKVPLQAYLSLLGQADLDKKVSKLESVLADLSPKGIGLQLVDFYGQLKLDELKGQRVRIEIVLPFKKENVNTLATVMWCKEVEVQGRSIIRLGAKFQEPIPELVEIIQNLIKQKKRDQQLLWSLWDAKTTNL